MTRRHATVPTGLGDLTMVADGPALTGLYFPGHWHLPAAAEFGVAVPADDAVFAQTARELTEYLAGRRRDFDVEVVTDGDDFSERVWALLRGIPYGATTTYGALARRLGNPRLAQRVGQCVGRNPVSVLIPCHRVVGADGSLTGYAGGLDRKRRLLELEEPAETAVTRLF
ncbi:methylated-DNA--[protein]-cysteine S-methyltransferase [Gordonia shandongensis]|uniref:methylated-DNA--[protein]-cysteine S-methyltransferase n=1 Tax=Gordonia shandongensis TaxID=376351 RepID=UPI00040BD2CE|nr:methylated-DNA--[protein]-cysteine S-methyltransferase [Gordonia shandongensis]